MYAKISFQLKRISVHGDFAVKKHMRGAYHLKENFGNPCWKVNGKLTFRKFQPKIKEYVLRQFFHCSWYEPNGMLLTICQFLGSLSVPDSRYTNSPPLWIQTVTDVALCGNLINRLPLCFRHPNRIFLSNGKHPSSLESHTRIVKKKKIIK